MYWRRLLGLSIAKYPILGCQKLECLDAVNQLKYDHLLLLLFKNIP
jgi:hypothetical protein